MVIVLELYTFVKDIMETSSELEMVAWIILLVVITWGFLYGRARINIYEHRQKKKIDQQYK